MKSRIAGWALVLSALVGVMPACSSAEADASADEAAGQITMQLSAQVNGKTYRLRNARFVLSGGAGQHVLDSESDPTAASITAALPSGTYAIELLPGWALQRQDGA